MKERFNSHRNTNMTAVSLFLNINMADVTSCENALKDVVALESCRFWAEYGIFSILNSACAWTSVILAGNYDCCRHSTASFSENVVVTETSFKVLEILSFCGREMAYAPSVKITVPIFWVKNKCNEAFRGVYNWRILEKILSQIPYW